MFSKRIVTFSSSRIRDESEINQNPTLDFRDGGRTSLANSNII